MKPLGFAMSRYWTRKVALKVAYLGGAYKGNTMSAVDADNTVEAKLSEAMVRLKLIDSFEASGWSRCGRTDKGVSAWANVCTMTVRSQLRGRGAAECRDPGMTPPVEPMADEKDRLEELDYVKVRVRVCDGGQVERRTDNGCCHRRSTQHCLPTFASWLGRLYRLTLTRASMRARVRIVTTSCKTGWT